MASRSRPRTLVEPGVRGSHLLGPVRHGAMIAHHGPHDTGTVAPGARSTRHTATTRFRPPAAPPSPSTTGAARGPPSCSPTDGVPRHGVGARRDSARGGGPAGLVVRLPRPRRLRSRPGRRLRLVRVRRRRDGRGRPPGPRRAGGPAGRRPLQGRRRAAAGRGRPARDLRPPLLLRTDRLPVRRAPARRPRQPLSAGRDGAGPCGAAATRPSSRTRRGLRCRARDPRRCAPTWSTACATGRRSVELSADRWTKPRLRHGRRQRRATPAAEVRCPVVWPAGAAPMRSTPTCPDARGTPSPRPVEVFATRHFGPRRTRPVRGRGAPLRRRTHPPGRRPRKHEDEHTRRPRPRRTAEARPERDSPGRPGPDATSSGPHVSPTSSHVADPLLREGVPGCAKPRSPV